jgi:hypothetical protein
MMLREGPRFSGPEDALRHWLMSFTFEEGAEEDRGTSIHIYHF